MPQLLHHSLRHLPLLAAAAALAATLAACSSVAQQPGPDSKTQFVQGWSESARPLFYHGMGRNPGYNIWQVPNNLPSGTYRVIVRKKDAAGDTAELVDGQRFEVDATRKDIYLNISTDYRDPEALGEKYIVGFDGVPAK